MHSAKRGRPRSETAREAILLSTLELIQQDEFDSVTIKAIASAAGVGRQTIYRWWNSRSAVALEAIQMYGRSRIEAANSRVFEKDLCKFLQDTFRAASRLRSALVMLMADALVDQAFGEQFRESFIRERRRELQRILRRGIDQGALRPDTDIAYLLDLVYGPMWYRLLNQHAKLNPKLARQLTDTVILVAGPAPSPTI